MGEFAATITKADMDLIAGLKDIKNHICEEIGKVIVGQNDVVALLLNSIFSRAHCLLIGVPGLAKTLLIKTLADTLDMKFSRIQFTPDLMPADITGTDVIYEDKQSGERKFKFIKGPVFANIVLADEINRTPPKTQAALLQAMQEGIVTTGETTYKLDPPFFVLATQNPIEQEGTYPLPEAQLDRFMFSVNVGYPSAEEECEIVRRTTVPMAGAIQRIYTKEEILLIQNSIRKIPVSDHVVQYAVSIVRSTRPKEQSSPQFIKDWVGWGAGPRAAQYLVIGAKTFAAMRGEVNVSCEDVRQAAFPVLAHRVLTSFAAEADGVTSQDIVQRIIESTPEPAPAR